MDNIIEALVQIEERAQSITDDTEKEKIRLAKKLDSETAKIRASVERETDAKIKKLRDFVRDETKRKNEAIKAESAKKTVDMRKLFDDNHQKWEDAIFNKITGR
jgi:vacuolar-type H+-ATPase subunit E/Vma4